MLTKIKKKKHINIRTNGLFDQWPLGLVALRTNGPSEYRDISVVCEIVLADVRNCNSTV